MSYKCPKCLRVSHHPEDEKNRFCGVCGHAYDLSVTEPDTVPGQIGYMQLLVDAHKDDIYRTTMFRRVLESLWRLRELEQ